MYQVRYAGGLLTKIKSVLKHSQSHGLNLTVSILQSLFLIYILTVTILPCQSFIINLAISIFQFQSYSLDHTLSILQVQSYNLNLTVSSYILNHTVKGLQSQSYSHNSTVSICSQVIVSLLEESQPSRVRAALSRDGVEVYGDHVNMHPMETRAILLQVCTFCMEILSTHKQL